MPSPLVITQFARLVGREALLDALGLPAGAHLPEALGDEQRAQARRLAADRAAGIAEALVAEALILDDIQDAAAARGYLEERLTVLDPLLPDTVKVAARARLEAIAGRWGRPEHHP